MPIDTGLLWFDAATTRKLLDLAHDDSVAGLCGLATAGAQENGGLHLYTDLLLPLAASTSLEGYLADESDGPAGPAVRRARDIIWQRLRQTPLSVERLQPAFFAQLSTSAAYWSLAAGDAAAAHTLDWTDQAAAWSPDVGRR